MILVVVLNYILMLGGYIVIFLDDRCICVYSSLSLVSKANPLFVVRLKTSSAVGLDLGPWTQWSGAEREFAFIRKTFRVYYPRNKYEIVRCRAYFDKGHVYSTTNKISEMWSAGAPAIAIHFYCTVVINAVNPSLTAAIQVPRSPFTPPV